MRLNHSLRTSLKFFVDTATGKLMSNTWSDKNVIAYCGSNGLNTAGIEMLIQHTKNMKALNMLTSKKESMTEDEGYILKDKIANASERKASARSRPRSRR